MKKCSTCGIEFELIYFNKNKSNKDGYEYRCKDCTRKRVNEWCNNNKEKRKKYKKDYRQKHKERLKNMDIGYRLKKEYNLTLNQKNQMIKDQNGLCYCCKKELGTNPNNNHVDHDHKTGRIRKILCSRCNITIGGLKEDPILTQQILDYINNICIGDSNE